MCPWTFLFPVRIIARRSIQFIVWIVCLCLCDIKKTKLYRLDIKKRFFLLRSHFMWSKCKLGGATHSKVLATDEMAIKTTRTTTTTLTEMSVNTKSLQSDFRIDQCLSWESRKRSRIKIRWMKSIVQYLSNEVKPEIWSPSLFFSSLFMSRLTGNESTFF